MFRREEFRNWLESKKYKPNTVSTHIWYAQQLDEFFNLEEKLKQLGTDGILEWSREQSNGPFEKYPSNTRTVIRRYVEFALESRMSEDEAPDFLEDEIHEPLLFDLEKQMQAAVRRQLTLLEPGLVEADGGVERIVATGKIDIVALDKHKDLVVIELKAGKCPSGALEQILGYADALADETGKPVRAILVAGSFSDRTQAAARRAIGLTLKTYTFSVAFGDVQKI